LRSNPLLTASLLSGLWLLVGRLTGFGRDYVIASEFGLTELSDALVVLLVFPELMPQIFLASSIAVSLVKLLPKTERATHLFSSIIIFFSIPYIVIASLLIAIPLGILNLVGGDEYLVSNLGAFHLLLIGFITFVSYLSIVICGGINAYSKFGFSQSSVAVLNLILIFSIYFGEGSIEGFIYGLLFAYVGRLIWIMFEPTARTLFAFPVSMDAAQLKIVLRVLLTAFAVSAVMLGLNIVSRFISGDQESGLASQVHYQLRVADMLVGILSAFISVVWLPRLVTCSHIASVAFIRLFSHGLRQTFICVLFGLYCLDSALTFLWSLYFNELSDQAAMQQSNGAIISLFSIGAFSSFFGCLWIARNDWKTPSVALALTLIFMMLIINVIGATDIVSAASASLLTSLLVVVAANAKFSILIIRQAFGSDWLVPSSLIGVAGLLGVEQLFMTTDDLGYLAAGRVIMAICVVALLSYYYTFSKLNGKEVK
jgi:peptidoglycan biosynthesis protein MviN/MurJ (putative lipid II flippase)